MGRLSSKLSSVWPLSVVVEAAFGCGPEVGPADSSCDLTERELIYESDEESRPSLLRQGDWNGDRYVLETRSAAGPSTLVSFDACGREAHLITEQARFAIPQSWPGLVLSCEHDDLVMHSLAGEHSPETLFEDVCHFMYAGDGLVAVAVEPTPRLVHRPSPSSLAPLTELPIDFVPRKGMGGLPLALHVDADEVLFLRASGELVSYAFSTGELRVERAGVANFLSGWDGRFVFVQEGSPAAPEDVLAVTPVLVWDRQTGRTVELTTEPGPNAGYWNGTRTLAVTPFDADRPGSYVVVPEMTVRPLPANAIVVGPWRDDLLFVSTPLPGADPAPATLIVTNIDSGRQRELEAASRPWIEDERGRPIIVQRRDGGWYDAFSLDPNSLELAPLATRIGVPLDWVGEGRLLSLASSGDLTSLLLTDVTRDRTEVVVEPLEPNAAALNLGRRMDDPIVYEQSGRVFMQRFDPR